MKIPEPQRSPRKAAPVCHLELRAGMAFLSDVGYLNRRVDVYSPRAFCRGPMLRLNIKAAGNSDGHWSSETPGAGKEHHAETRCSILVPKPSIQQVVAIRIPNSKHLGVGVLSGDLSS